MSGARPPGTPRAHSRRQSVYLPVEILTAMDEEARRLGISLSKVIQQTWINSRAATTPPVTDGDAS